MATTDTIAAIATPPGRGGVGVIRISGPDALEIGERLCDKKLIARKAIYAEFKDETQATLDSGIALFFAGPKSFTGENVVEIQGHGGPVVQDLLLATIIRLGARQAKPGEFSERAFHNDKLDLAQAEAIADLIDSSTAEAAKGAMRSLQGEFSAKVHALLERLVHLRMYVEAAIDFPDEEIDFLADAKVQSAIEALQTDLRTTLYQAGQGAVLRNGLRLVIAGKPNAGKSSLLNALSGHDAAIVTDIPGTTRDVIRETISIDGLPVHIIDTAGLRESEDQVEQIGVQRAHQAIDEADHVLLVVDAQDVSNNIVAISHASQSTVINKIDLLPDPLSIKNGVDSVYVSAKTGAGIDELKAHIKELAGFSQGGETLYTARRRHITALEQAQAAVDRGLEQLRVYRAGELLADELLQAQNALNSITGEFTADDLLGEIFAGFCIGK
ncbi:tRNA modification GTPase MnmE [Arenicella chitinivorans]|uniref:tRNA modification GTPase MnmE n=1 Tax=Arenicella chitinivorans TaxID=1329800 RepID=A0A918RX43_9GAMM|nr:tRNA uridine-5-carboxymethylaminomethyl(34) synthesis GTPase MnmE [Arenicella chitinivorans]GHA14320.1 tRNA modification GTPase MnmE [Arenicella chitinivorans]